MIISQIAEQENIKISGLRKNLNDGTAVIVKNTRRKIKPLAIGKDLAVKINTNIGASTEIHSLPYELKKLNAALEAKADTVMDLSVGGNLRKIRKAILEKSPIPVGTVPIYEAAVRAEKKFGTLEKMTPSLILETIEQQAEEGVDFFTIHCGVTKKIAHRLKKKKRLGGVVSRGGAILTRWILANKKENPLKEIFNDIIDIAKKYNIVLSLGDGLRPGALADSLDYYQIEELKTLGEFAGLARKKGAQVIIEGPGHVPIDQIKKNVDLEKKLCNEAPFYILGPLVIDSALGFDHITSAIGSSIAAFYGADFLCVVTPKEHLGQPGPEDLKKGTIAAKIAAQSVNILKNKKLREKENILSLARKKRNWEKHINSSLYPKEAKKMTKGLKLSDICTMCGEYCSLKMLETVI